MCDVSRERQPSHGETTASAWFRSPSGLVDDPEDIFGNIVGRVDLVDSSQPYTHATSQHSQVNPHHESTRTTT